MTNQEIYELIARFDSSTLHSLRLTRGDFSIELGRGSAGTPAPAARGEDTAPPPAPQSGETISAPLVGIFYAAPAPDRPPFVSAGDRVEKGQTVCLIEAMKMMSEVPAPCDCVIEEVVKANGELVSFGEPLFRCRPC